MRNVVVTGASRGIGLAIVRELARSEYRVLAIARRETPDLRTIIEQTKPEESGDVRFVSFDLEKTEEISGFIRSLREAHGPIYGLVNNAGISVEGALARTPEKDIERVVQLNVLAPILVARQAVRSMMASGEGRIVNMASMVATTGFSGLSAYAATKASIVGFTRSLAREVGPLGITVNAVAPGFVETDLTASAHSGQLASIARRSALKRLATTKDVAEAVDFLLSEKARSITGVVLPVDAGATA